MGPQLHRCGKDVPGRGRDRGGRASMGPQLHRCGKLPLVPALGARRQASMGPQLHRCGKAGVAIVHAPAPLLQWGRNFIVAERSMNERRAKEVQSASMGPQLHRCGKNARLRGWERSCLCFNGAATSSLRKVLRLLLTVSISGWLQWGRNFIVAESRPQIRQ